MRRLTQHRIRTRSASSSATSSSVSACERRAPTGQALERNHRSLSSTAHAWQHWHAAQRQNTHSADVPAPAAAGPPAPAAEKSSKTTEEVRWRDIGLQLGAQHGGNNSAQQWSTQQGGSGTITGQPLTNPRQHSTASGQAAERTRRRRRQEVSAVHVLMRCKSGEACA